MTNEKILPGADFADRFSVFVANKSYDAISACEIVMGQNPFWVSFLMRLRNFVVKPFGLKTDISQNEGHIGVIGIFPVLAKSPTQVVLGFDDKHLDFRIVVDLIELGQGRQEIAATTLVKTHNFLGRAYLAAVMPFHKLIVPVFLAKA